MIFAALNTGWLKREEGVSCFLIVLSITAYGINGMSRSNVVIFFMCVVNCVLLSLIINLLYVVLVQSGSTYCCFSQNPSLKVTITSFSYAFHKNK